MPSACRAALITVGLPCVRGRVILVVDEATPRLLGAALGDCWQEMVSDDPGVGLAGDCVVPFGTGYAKIIPFAS